MSDTTDTDAFLDALKRANALPPSDPPQTDATRRRNAEVLENARLAVEWDPVRLAPLLGARRLAAAVSLAPRVELCEALLAGIPVPAHRLDQDWVKALDLHGGVVLDDELALRVAAHGPVGGKAA